MRSLCRAELLDFEEWSRALEEGLGTEILQVEDDAMCWQDDQPFAVHIHEGHHRCCFRIRGMWQRGRQVTLAGVLYVRRSILLAIVQRCLVAMVAVGDDQLLVAHG